MRIQPRLKKNVFAHLLSVVWLALLPGTVFAGQLPPTKPKPSAKPTVQASSPTDTTIKAIDLQKSFAQTGLVLQLTVPVKLTLSHAAGTQHQVSIKGSGPGYQARAEEVTTTGQPPVIVVSLTQAGYATGNTSPGSTATQPVEVAIQLAPNSSLQGQVSSGTIVINGLEAAQLTLDLGQGDVEVGNSSGHFYLSTRQGNLSCHQSDLTGNLAAPSGSITLAGSRGRFSASAGSGSISVNTPTQQVSAQLSGGADGSVRLVAAEGDVQASVYKGNLDFTWAGPAQATGLHFDFMAQQGAMDLHFPEAFSLDMNLDQVQTVTGTAGNGAQPVSAALPVAGNTTGKMQSEFAKASLPAEKIVTHQGKRLAITQGRQLINGGRNLLMIHAADSQVYLKKVQ